MIIIECCEDYEDCPDEMNEYLKNYGWNFNLKACEYAISKFGKEGFVSWNKELVDALLKKENITLQNDELYNSVYVANYIKAYHLNGSITTDTLVAKCIKECIDSNDSDLPFVLWHAGRCHIGNPIPWKELL